MHADLSALVYEGRKVKRKSSAIEATLALHIRAVNLPDPKRNYVFLPGRKLELDFCWPELKFGVEVEGAVHRIKERFHGDIEKHALALIHGWTVMRVDGRAIRSGAAIGWLQELWTFVQNRNHARS